MASSGAQPNPEKGSAKSREHNQGRQDREYTPAQKAAVDRVRKCKATEYYNILDVKVEASDGEIKKAYRKLALIMHPDKNGAPGADEAFKLVSRAFQVLSDPGKRTSFDRHGTDPDARPEFSSAPRGGNPFGFTGTPGGRGGQMFENEISPEELFNMFFGGGGGPAGGIFGDGGGGGGFTFGGPGIRVHQFGGAPRQRRTQQTQEPEVEQGFTKILIQLLPLIFFFLLPLLGSLFTGDNSEVLRGPQFRLNHVHPFTERRQTPTYGIPFWVKPADFKEMKKGDVLNFDKRAETTIVNGLQVQCHREREDRRAALEAARGWIFVDQEKEKMARARPTPSCQKLGDLGIREARYY